MSDLRDLLHGEMQGVAGGEDFAAAFGARVRGRVRRRRAVHAASVGSVAAVGVGAVALGVAKLPGLVSEPAEPGATLSVEVCPAGSMPIDGAALYGEYQPVPGVSPTAHAINISEDRARETWIIYDDVAGQPAAEFTVMRDGTVSVIETNGATYAIAPNPEGLYVFEAPGGGWVTFEAGSGVSFGWSADQPTGVSPSTEATDPGTGVLCVPEEDAAATSEEPSGPPEPVMTATAQAHLPEYVGHDGYAYASQDGETGELLTTLVVNDDGNGVLVRAGEPAELLSPNAEGDFVFQDRAVPEGPVWVTVDPDPEDSLEAVTLVFSDPGDHSEAVTLD